MWPWRRRNAKGKHRKVPGAELEKRLKDVTKEHEQNSLAVSIKANRLDAAADKLIASNRAALKDAAQGGR